MVKKRPASGSASSASATPAPVGLGANGTPASAPTPASPTRLGSVPLPTDEHLLAPALGPARGGGSASTTPAPRLTLPARDERTIARQGTVVASSGDGPAHGDECFIWSELPMNKQGYRYAPCAPSPTISPNPLLPFYRTIPGPPPCPPVHLSWVDRSAFLRLSEDGLTCSTDRGWRSARGTVAVREGTWYYEAIVLRGDGQSGAGRGTSAGDHTNAHVRLGWGRREAGIDAPVGADAYSYAIRDVGGHKVHISRPKPYGKTFRKGDVLGCLIHLPQRPTPTSEDDPAYVRRWRVPIRYKGQLYFEMDDYPVAKEMENLVNREGKPQPTEPPPEAEPPKKGTGPPPGKGSKGPPATARSVSRQLRVLPGSYINFYLNGKELAPEPAFTDLYDFLPLPPLHPISHRNRGPASTERERERCASHDDGTLGYFPMVSCFGQGKVRVNFGPAWEARPADLPPGTRGIAERWEEWRAEELAYDERDEAALEERYKREAAEAALAALNPPAPKLNKSKKRKKAPGDGATPSSTRPGTPGARSTPGLDRATPGLDRGTPGLDRATPGLDHTTPGLDGTTPGLDGMSLHGTPVPPTPAAIDLNGEYGGAYRSVVSTPGPDADGDAASAGTDTGADPPTLPALTPHSPPLIKTEPPGPGGHGGPDRNGEDANEGIVW